MSEDILSDPLLNKIIESGWIGPKPSFEQLRDAVKAGVITDEEREAILAAANEEDARKLKEIRAEFEISE